VQIYLRNKTFGGFYDRHHKPPFLIFIVGKDKYGYLESHYYDIEKSYGELDKYLRSNGYIYYDDIYERIKDVIVYDRKKCSLCGAELVTIESVTSSVFTLPRDLIDFVMENPDILNNSICCNCYGDLTEIWRW
jgi:hypothetical protein